MKILFAEDTKDLNKAVCAVLVHEGYAVTPAYDGQEALDAVLQDSFDCIILDIMMPKLDGISVLKDLREKSILTPVLLLTAKAQVDDRVTGLDSGADDYLTKPFAMKELLARIRALTRRKNSYSREDIQYEDVSLKAGTLELTSESSVRLSIKEFELMQTLLLNVEREISTGYLLEHVWQNEEGAQEEVVWLYISYLNGKLDSISSKLRILGEKGGSYAIRPGGRKE